MIRRPWLAALLALSIAAGVASACGGSSSETPPPLEPSAAELRAREPEGAASVAPPGAASRAPREPSPSQSDPQSAGDQPDVPATWGKKKKQPAEAAAPVPPASTDPVPTESAAESAPAESAPTEFAPAEPAPTDSAPGTPIPD